MDTILTVHAAFLDSGSFCKTKSDDATIWFRGSPQMIDQGSQNVKLKRTSYENEIFFIFFYIFVLKWRKPQKDPLSSEL